jgi:capsular exopolysaccharide synthesis family protein
LTTVLLGQETLERALQQVPGYDCLWVLGAGPIPPNPAELLSGARAKKVFTALAENFDLVLVDSPPVLPVTDAMVLSNYADGTLLVVAAGQTRRAELQRAAERFTQAKSPLVGIVLNEVTKQSGYGSTGYGYGYGYAPYKADASLVEVPAQANGTSDAKPAGSGRRGHRPR